MLNLGFVELFLTEAVRKNESPAPFILGALEVVHSECSITFVERWNCPMIN